MNPLSNSDTLITIFGASGFLGRHVVRALAPLGYRIRAAVRRPDLAGPLQPLGRVGQIQPVQANLRHPASVEAALQDASIAINLVGILYERGRQRFDDVHEGGAGAVARAAAVRGIKLIHVSALGADPESSAAYARSKAAGEQAVLGAVPEAVIFRPSIIFGPDDAFFNKFAAMARMSPVLPLIGGGHTRFQPVFGGDVAAAVAKAVSGEARPGTIYELGGPEVFTFKELMAFILKTTERHCLLAPVPYWLAKLKAEVLQYLPTPLLTPDQVELLRQDTVVSAEAQSQGRTLEGLGLEPRAIETIVPTYLWRYRKSGQFRRSMA